jgi:hypothetical protein
VLTFSPIAVILLDGWHRASQPSAVFLLFVNAEDHAREEGRLRACQVVGAVGVENLAVVGDLVEEVLDHVAREFGLAVAQ